MYHFFFYFAPQACFCLQLQVPDEALSLVISMGFNERDAKRALRMNNQDVGGAVDFLVEQKAKEEQKREEDNQRRIEIMLVSLRNLFDFDFPCLYYYLLLLNSTIAGSKRNMGSHP